MVESIDKQALEVVAWYSPTGHGTHFREHLPAQFQAIEFGGVPMWAPLVRLSAAQAVIAERDAEIARLKIIELIQEEQMNADHQEITRLKRIAEDRLAQLNDDRRAYLDLRDKFNAMKEKRHD